MACEHASRVLVSYGENDRFSTQAGKRCRSVQCSIRPSGLGAFIRLMPRPCRWCAAVRPRRGWQHGPVHPAEAPKDRCPAAGMGAQHQWRCRPQRCIMSAVNDVCCETGCTKTVSALGRAGQPAVYLLAQGAMQEVNWYKQQGSWFAGDSVIEGDMSLMPERDSLRLRGARSVAHSPRHYVTAGSALPAVVV